MIKGIKAIKCRVQESLFMQRIEQTRSQELAAFSKYCNIKNICGAIYFNAGIIISALVFLLVSKEKLDLGKVFSTMALLSHIFNFSIVYSNLAIEQLFQLKVYNRRIEEVITGPFDEGIPATKQVNERLSQRAELESNASNLFIEFKDAAVTWDPVLPIEDGVSKAVI